VLVVGVEKMTDTARPGDRQHPVEGQLREGEAETAGGFAGIFAKIASLLPEDGDQSDALAPHCRQEPQERVGNPFARLRKDLGLRLLPRRIRKRTRSWPGR